MQITTRRYGPVETIEVTAAQIYEFSPGLVGFAEHQRYALIPDADSPIEWLQSLDDPAVTFAVVEPFLFAPSYAFELGDADAGALGLGRAEDATVRCLLTIRAQAAAITANLMAPIVLNTRARRGRQIVLQDSVWPLRFPVLDGIESLDGEAAPQEAGPSEHRAHAA